MSTWDQVTELLARVTEAPVDQREALLLQSGLPPEVVEETRRLLAAWENDPDFLDPKPEKLEILGPWRLVREIGRGGAGQVFEAVHMDPTDGRRVAIKVIAEGRLNAGQTEAFLQERSLLAKLEHPNIARLYETGKTPGGAPYFAMEFVEGLPVDRWVSETGAGLRACVAMFVKVLSALGYAHGRLVVHGDIKPANLLVTAAGEPRLLDFGAGRSLSDGAENPPLWPSLTPGFASPEQLSGQGASTASDLYQVGLLLRRCASKGDADLDAIAAKCLAESPSARYGSADALRADLEAWLALRPVSAVPHGWWYLSRKFVQRSPAWAALFASLAVGLATTGWLAWRAHRSSVESLHRFEEARRVTQAMFRDIRNLPVDARKPIVENMANLLDRSADPNETDPVVLLELANAWRSLAMVTGLPNTPNLGDRQGALRSYSKAIDLVHRAKVRDPRAALNRLPLYHAEAALVCSEMKGACLTEHLRLLDDSILALKRYGPSEALAYAVGQGAYFHGHRDRKDGIARYTEAVSEFERAGLGRSRLFTTPLKRFGALLLVEDRTEEAVKHYRRALEIERNDASDPFDMSYTLSDLAAASMRLKRYPEALAYVQEALQIRENAVRKDPADVRAQLALANVLTRLGSVHWSMGNLPGAVAAHRRALAAWAEMAKNHHNIDGHARGVVNLAFVLHEHDKQKHAGEIADLLRQAMQIAREHPELKLESYIEANRLLPAARAAVAKR